MKIFSAIISLFLIELVLSGFSLCQNIDSITVRYARTVSSFSSEYSKTSYSVNQILGIPDTYPSYGDNPSAWASYTADSQREYLELKYSDAEPIQYVAVYETYNPGAVDTIYVKNPSTGKWVVVWLGVAQSAVESSRVFLVSFPMTSFNVSEIRLAINSPKVDGWNEIDAVAISDEAIETKP